MFEQLTMVFSETDQQCVGWDLTRREHDVLSLLAGGLPNTEIASALFISNNTLKTHMRNIFSKLDVNDRTQAAIWAVRWDRRI